MVKLDSTTQNIKRQYAMLQLILSIPGEPKIIIFSSSVNRLFTAVFDHLKRVKKLRQIQVQCS